MTTLFGVPARMIYAGAHTIDCARIDGKISVLDAREWRDSLRG